MPNSRVHGARCRVIVFFFFDHCPAHPKAQRVSDKGPIATPRDKVLTYPGSIDVDLSPGYRHPCLYPSEIQVGDGIQVLSSHGRPVQCRSMWVLLIDTVLVVVFWLLVLISDRLSSVLPPADKSRKGSFVVLGLRVFSRCWPGESARLAMILSSFQVNPFQVDACTKPVHNDPKSN